MAARSRPRPGGAGGRMWLLGLGSGLLAVTAAPTATLGVMVLLPAAVALLADPAGNRAVARIVLVAGLAMAVSPAARLWAAGGGWVSCLGIVSDIRTLAAAWAVQGSAWLTAELAPLAVKLVLDMVAAARAARLRADRVRLEQEWGLPPGAP